MIISLHPLCKRPLTFLKHLPCQGYPNIFQFALIKFSTLPLSLIMESSPQKQFYRRTLPDTCISFSSPKGKQLFMESMSAGHMECYFKLASQFRTQDEPAFCGLTTLVMILNSLEIDPGKVWKGPWRWYHENMLDCCVPIQLIAQSGITLEQFLCLANCNGIETKSVRPSEKVTEEDFRKTVQEYTTRDDSFLVCSYSRAVLKQTGDGHFSPVGGYHPGEDMVLVLDTARFKYPPHWISVPLLWESMKALDKSTGEPRGYIRMSKLENTSLLLLFRISPILSASLPSGCTNEMKSFVETWHDWLSQAHSMPADDIEASTETMTEAMVLDGAQSDCFLKDAVAALQQSLSHLKNDQSILTTQLDLKCFQDISQQHKCVIHELIREIESLKVFSTLTVILKDAKFMKYLDKTGQIATCITHEELPNKIKCNLPNKVLPAHFVTIFLLCWPYSVIQTFAPGTNGYLLNTLLQNIVASGNAKRVTEEVILLRKQLGVMLEFCDQIKTKKLCNNCSCKSK